jgi:predicted RNA-binding Zn-ribbon protein involved in translation (DUF1610 family)
MALRQPESMEECVYYTKRSLGDKGKIIVWVFREKCPKCGKGLMGKPVVKGKVKTRADTYECPECKFSLPKEEYEDSLKASIDYLCNHCGHKGELQISFKRKKVRFFDEEKQKKVNVDALVFNCEKCGEQIAVTKKLK